jgi:hypothetical protein
MVRLVRALQTTRFLLLVSVLALGTGCNRRATGGALIDPEPTGLAPPSPAPVTAVPDGTSCAGRGDCTTDQLCVRNVCTYRLTSASGEVLAAAARAQVEAGDLEGALRTFDQAIEAFEAAEAPVPSRLTCGVAAAALRAARTPEARELAAKAADRCFRKSLPGVPERLEVQTALARLRYDGLAIARFDRPEPADQFFSAPPTRPTVDAIDIAIDMAQQQDQPGYPELRVALQGEPARRAIADCFVQDWELRHERQASASLTLKLTTRLRDMGDYDAYEGTVEVTKTTAAEEGFEACLAGALTGVLGTGPRMSRVVAWQAPFEVAARLQ